MGGMMGGGGGGSGGGMGGPVMGAANYWGVERPAENRKRNLDAKTSYYQGMLGNDKAQQSAIEDNQNNPEGSVYKNIMNGIQSDMNMGQDQEGQDGKKKNTGGGGSPYASMAGGAGDSGGGGGSPMSGISSLLPLLALA